MTTSTSRPRRYLLASAAAAFTLFAAGCAASTGSLADQIVAPTAVPAGNQLTPVATETGKPSGVADPAPSVTLGFTGSLQTVIVPAGVTAMNIQAVGGSGGNGAGSDAGQGGTGAAITGTITVEPGETIDVNVGEEGGHYGTNPDNNHGGWGVPGSGGVGGVNTYMNSIYAAGGGGGASTVSINGQTLMIAAGGGGGASGGGIGHEAGNGGSASSSHPDGFRGECAGYGDGGHAGEAPAANGAPGGVGGGQADATGGGGGGGVIGGQGGHGGNCAGGGGAGNSSVDPSVSGGTVTAGSTQGSGSVSIDWIVGS